MSLLHFVYSIKDFTHTFLLQWTHKAVYLTKGFNLTYSRVQIVPSGTGASAQQLWLHPVLSSMGEHSQLEASQLSLCSFSVCPISSDQQKVAVLASTTQPGRLCLQLLSVCDNAQPVVMGTYAVTVDISPPAASSVADSSTWRCCYSKYGQVLMYMEKGSSAFVWSLTTGNHVWQTSVNISLCTYMCEHMKRSDCVNPILTLSRAKPMQLPCNIVCF